VHVHDYKCARTDTHGFGIHTIMHPRWEVDYPPSQPVGSGFVPHWRPQTAKLPSFGGYSLETLPYLTIQLWTGPIGNTPSGFRHLVSTKLVSRIKLRTGL